ncbi:carbohydrate-binding module family 32 [Glonium stellatum]|uniref:Carbohydrate-binding module family 32 n=1 Tax=Glonium stellatum TaxID=574774 RepID=A0A8E2EMM1_9PEZI|nr:carbohydrate-binding module family 32 [Glonium stellatum]
MLHKSTALALFTICLTVTHARPSGGSLYPRVAVDAVVAGNAAVAQAVPIDRTGWTVTADSYQPGNEPSNVLDGNTGTFWHTEYSPTNAALPHNLTIDLKALYWINGLSYLPRQDGSSNGNIGQHIIQLSADNSNWVTVATGTYLNDASLKQTLFASTHARYVRLTAQTEAQGAGNPWTKINLHDGSGKSSYSPPPTSLGQWGETIDFPIVPVAAVVLNTGKVLTWSSFEANSFSGGGGLTQTATYDPSTGIVSQRTVTNTGHDMFCPGLSIDASGRTVVTGGNNDLKTSIYNPASDAWVSAANMNITRGYQAQVTLFDGRIFVIGGSWSDGTASKGGKNGEIYNSTTNTWTELPGCPVAPMLTQDAQGVYRADNHGWLFGWKNGFVFQAGPSKAMNWYGMAGSGTQEAAGNRGDDADAMNGNAVMYDAVNGKILAIGGATSYQDTTATSNAHIITIGAPNTTATVTTIGSMVYARGFANSIVLPDGKVFIVGGQKYVEPFSDDTAVYYPEMWDPTTQKFTTLNPMYTPRTYHSVALLLPDGTVFSGGGGLCGTCTTNHFDAQIYSPPYLFNTDGSRATRPKITSASPTSIKVGGSIVVATDSAVTSFSLIRQGSATHSVDTDQRRIALTPTGSGTSYTVAVPSDPGIAIPGYWMLFALTSAGVPSLAQTILVTL